MDKPRDGRDGLWQRGSFGGSPQVAISFHVGRGGRHADTCGLRPEYRDSPKTQAGPGTCLRGSAAVRQGYLLTATAVGRKSLLWAVWQATDAWLEGEARVRKREEKWKPGKYIRMFAALSASGLARKGSLTEPTSFMKTTRSL